MNVLTDCFDPGAPGRVFRAAGTTMTAAGCTMPARAVVTPDGRYQGQTFAPPLPGHLLHRKLTDIYPQVKVSI